MCHYDPKAVWIYSSSARISYDNKFGCSGLEGESRMIIKTGRTSEFGLASAFRPASALRVLSMVCLAMLCAAAGGSTRTVTLILGSRVELGPLQGVPTNLGYSPVNGLIADLNGDGAPDIVVGINGSPPVVYLNNGTSNPFQNVPGIFVSPPPGPTSPPISFGSVTVADVNSDGHPHQRRAAHEWRLFHPPSRHRPWVRSGGCDRRRQR